MPLNERTKKLREMMIQMPAICTERLKYMTESYKQTEAYPAIMRRAMALDHILKNMTVNIYPDEKLVGCFTSKVRGGAVIPEINGGWLLDELDVLSTREWDTYLPLSEEEKQTLREDLAYWDGKSLFDQWKGMVPEEAQRLNHLLITSGGHSENGHHLAHCAVDFKRHLELGSRGTIENARACLERLDCSVPEDFEQYQFWRSVVVVHESLIAFAHRYADKARELAAEEMCAERRSELEQIAERCEWVPENPARNFLEAVQSVWLLYVALVIEGWGAGMGLGRLDQYLMPYYAEDVKNGKLTRDQAQELITMLLIKMNGAINLQSQIVAESKGGYPIMMGITVGGITPSGENAVNEMTYIILDAENDVGLTSEDIVVRINRLNPQSYLEHALQIAKNLHGKLKFVSDDTTIESFLYLGFPLERARDYISSGCHCPNIPAFSRQYGIGGINHGLLMEMALNDGKSRVTGMQIGPHTGDARKFKTYNDVVNAYKAQFEAALKVTYIYKNADLRLMEQVPCPLQSSLFHGCLEKGRDINQGGTLPYYLCNTSIAGAPNVGDSFAAIKKVVFEDKSVSLSEMIDALEHNFEGYEYVFHLINKAPKFGNDDDYADNILKNILSYICDKCNGTSVYNGIRNETSCLALTVNIGFGAVVGALPDGRLANQPLAEGGISPYQGRNVCGATATLRSVAKLDQVKLTHGSILNMRIDDTLSSTPEKIRLLAMMVRTFCEEGGNLVQFNFASNALLRQAQEHPEHYRDLLIRVATYSAYFVELSRELQDDIIRRLELS